MTSSNPISWTRWRRLRTPVAFSERCFAETLDGGQAFRWNRGAGGEWTGAWGEACARLRLSAEGLVEWSVPENAADGMERAIGDYLDIHEDYSALRDRLPWRSDRILEGAMAAFPSLRLLRQPLGETLLCFLCSATKQIPQIKRMCENLAEAFGDRRPDGGRTLPSWPALARASEEDLRGCGLGFRAKNILATALVLAGEPGWEERVAGLSYQEAKAWLMRCPGVGEKVADCVLLFGARKLEAFPVDTWILKAMQKRYGLNGWTNAQVAHFARVHFGPAAGFAQQLLFAGERAGVLD